MADTDKFNVFSAFTGQTTTTGTGSASAPGVRSTNIILKDSLTDKYGAGTPLAITVLVVTALASSGSNDAMDVYLASDTVEAFNTPATLHGVIGTFAAVSAAGTRFVYYLSPTHNLAPYIGLYYISQTTDAFSAGAVAAWIGPASAVDVYSSYPKGYVAG